MNMLMLVLMLMLPALALIIEFDAKRKTVEVNFLQWYVERTVEVNLYHDDDDMLITR
jgi:hypothetical protein